LLPRAASLADADPLDLVADLVDASLVRISDDDRGEPRVGMLETIRAYALDSLEAAGDAEEPRRLHAEHFLLLSEQLKLQLESGKVEQLLHARRQFELELDNLREALSGTLASDVEERMGQERLRLGMALCGRLSPTR
jgi:predicted ATPase